MRTCWHLLNRKPEKEKQVKAPSQTGVAFSCRIVTYLERATNNNTSQAEKFLEKMDSSNQHTALLVIDMQAAVIGQLPDYKAITANVAEAISFARAQGIPVLFAVVNFRPGMPEVSMNNKLFAASKSRAANAGAAMEALMKIDPALAPLPGEIIIHKRRVSAFTGSDLEVVLRAQGIQHLVLSGVATSGAVLSTLCEAADKDYRITVLSDGCTDADREAHRVLTAQVFLRQATVSTLAEWTDKKNIAP
jgi:nicotinamidase-related amidase